MKIIAKTEIALLNLVKINKKEQNYFEYLFIYYLYIMMKQIKRI